MRKIYFIAVTLLIGISCSKGPGPGGTSSITGTLVEQNHSFGEGEITEIIFTNGAEVEHGDYWVLNNPSGSVQYYIYYDNPTWISESNPNLAGRTGIEVSFQYSDSNVEIAQNTMDALEAAVEGSFTFILNVDVLEITALVLGDAPDADEMTSPFELNVSNQGNLSSLSTENPAVDMRCYLHYGSNTVADDVTRTDANGGFIFNNLKKGDYTLQFISKDTVKGGELIIEKNLTILENKSMNDIGTVSIYN